MSNLVLSLFPGIDLLGRAFEMEGFCVVRGPDTLWGQDVRDFHPPLGAAVGIIGGCPCQDFSRARRTPPTGEGLELLGEFLRIVDKAWPEWFLIENVPGVPDVTARGYTVQRLNLNARDVGMVQNRLRCFQFGSRATNDCPAGRAIVIARSLPSLDESQPACLATEGRRSGVSRRTFADFCVLQGLPADFDLPGMSRGAKYRAVGNGVPIPMGRVIARAIRERGRVTPFRLCMCDCGRVVHGKATMATPACRKRMERLRRAS